MNFDNLFCYFPTPKIQRASKGFGKPINALPFSSTKKLLRHDQTISYNI